MGDLTQIIAIWESFFRFPSLCPDFVCFASFFSFLSNLTRRSWQSKKRLRRRGKHIVILWNLPGRSTPTPYTPSSCAWCVSFLGGKHGWDVSPCGAIPAQKVWSKNSIWILQSLQWFYSWLAIQSSEGHELNVSHAFALFKSLHWTKTFSIEQRCDDTELR